MFMRLFLLLSFFLAPFASAQDDMPLRRLLGADEAKAWQAVGRINMEGAGFCTGALIAPDLVLTAAHCMYFKRTGKPIPANKIHFLAGWRKGWAAAHRKVEPFQPHQQPRPGDDVMVVSYAQERSEVPSLQERCEMLGRQSAVLVLSCDVNYGASGAPIFVMQDGEPKIASVVSAMAEWNERDVALGVSLGLPLQRLKKQLEDTDPVYQKVTPKPGPSKLPQVGKSSDGAGSGAADFKPKTVTPPKK